MFSSTDHQNNYIFSIKHFNISILISLNNFSSSFLHKLQIIEITNVFLKRYDILGFSNFYTLQYFTANNAIQNFSSF